MIDPIFIQNTLFYKRPLTRNSSVSLADQEVVSRPVKLTVSYNSRKMKGTESKRPIKEAVKGHVVPA